MVGSHTSDVGFDPDELPHGSTRLPTTFPPTASPPLPTSCAPLPISTAPPATAPLNLTVSSLGTALFDGASSSTAPPPSIHAVNISAHIDFKLDSLSTNYSKWCRLMSFVLRKSGVESHVTVNSDSRVQTAQWRHDDLQILLMIYGTISDELCDVISAKGNTAYHAWFLLDAFFRDSLAGRVVHVGVEFRTTVQGDLRISDYCRCLQALADLLVHLDEHVSDKMLTL